MRIFLTGGTGYIGGAVLETLVRGGHQVTTLVRDAGKARRMQKLGAKGVVGDLANGTPWQAAAIGHDAFIHTARDAAPRGIETDRIAIETLAAAARESGICGPPNLNIRPKHCRRACDRSSHPTDRCAAR